MTDIDNMRGDTLRVVDENSLDNMRGVTQRVIQENSIDNRRGVTYRVYNVNGGSTPVIDELNVTPSTSAQVITAPEGTDGYSPVNVAAVTSSIDANITAGNIKKDVSILGVTGSYEGNVPTGTMYIISNGTYNVADKAIANVQVPTTAPDCYRVFQKNASGQLVNSTSTPFITLPTGTTDITAYCFANAYKDTPSSVLSGSIDLSSLTAISGNAACFNMFSGCTGLTSVDLSSVTTIGNSACTSMLSGCTGLTSVDLSSLKTIGSDGCKQMFFGCTGLTSVDLSSLKTVGLASCQQMLSGCTGLTSVDLSSVTTIGNSACTSMLSGCTGLTSVDLSSLKTIGSDGCKQMFFGCTGLTSVDLSSIVSITQANAVQYMFQNCTGLTSVDLSSVTSIVGNWPGNAMFYNCSSLNSVNLSSLSSIKNSNHAIEKLFYGCTSLSTVSFPCLHAGSFGTQTNQWDNMLQGVTGCTVHFPSNLQSIIGSWTNVVNGFGGTNTTVLYDLPATNTLTGADSKTYTRNPKYDTATALAWKVGAYDTSNFTPAYYTSGTTDPQVGDTIYSDSACTTAVTTISSIA